MLGEIIGSSVGEVIKGVGSLFTTDKDRLAAENMLRSHEATLMKSALEYEGKLATAQAAIIQAEANGKSWLQRNWRPLTMITFLLLIVARWLGWTAGDMSEDELLSVYELMKIGLGGYVVGRSAEKVVPSVMRAWAENRQRSTPQ